QGARVEEVLAERLQAANQVRGPIQLTPEPRATRRAAAVVGRLELDDLDVEDPRHAQQQGELLEVRLRLQVAVQVEQPRATPRTRRADAPGVDGVGLRVLGDVALAEPRLEGLVEGREDDVLADHTGE